ncbi:MAG: M18 family aminopeptidase [Clostridia bacterium]|nr:M18 family aminopeptidase [Clostridia bacterium]
MRDEILSIEATKQLLQFIDRSPTAFHAVENAAALLENAGFLRLNEVDEWKLEAGKDYYITRNQSTILAFRMPKATPKNFLIAASHTDSPMFKLKNECIAPAFDRYQRLNTEVYGGTILSSWLDRPLSLAGRVILHKDGNFATKTVQIDRDLLVIPNVAIHFNRSINSGFTYNPAVDMLPLMSIGKDVSVKKLLAEELGCNEDEIAGSDLYVYNRMKGTLLGASQEFFSAPRIDNLMCVWGTLQGFLQAEPRESVNVFFAADNEETGSATKQGAGSVMMSDIINRICEATGTDRRRMLAASMMVSADNAHAKHPNHPEMSDAQNAPHMGCGVVIKSNAAQKYTTDAVSATIFAEICRRSDVPVQYFANRSDMGGGSTLGSISNTLVPLMSVDIGMAQLAMHSAYETAGTADTAHLIAAMQGFYRCVLHSQGDGDLSIDLPDVQ